jgi:hypothetical protein
MAFSRRHLQELCHRGVLDRLGNGESEITPQVADGFALDVLDEVGVRRRVRVELVVTDELAGVLQARQVQPMPVDDGPPAQDQLQRLQVMQRQLPEGLQTPRFLGSRGPLGARRFAVAGNGQ